jgi:hypothetical protein
MRDIEHLVLLTLDNETALRAREHYMGVPLYLQYLSVSIFFIKWDSISFEKRVKRKISLFTISCRIHVIQIDECCHLGQFS